VYTCLTWYLAHGSLLSSQWIGIVLLGFFFAPDGIGEQFEKALARQPCEAGGLEVSRPSKNCVTRLNSPEKLGQMICEIWPRTECAGHYSPC
jgi:hypothetical protein